MIEDDPRIIRLEENVFFLEKRLGELDGQILSQQQEIARLEKELAEIHSLFHLMKEAHAKFLTERGSREIPPHYQSTAWHEE